MNLFRVKAVVLHAWYHLHHSMETWVDVFWFPIIHTIVFGFVALYFSQGGAAEKSGIILLGILLWQLIEIGTYSIAVGTLWEVWSQSFSSLFVAPLKLGEFVVGHMVFGLAKQIALFLILSTVAWVVYHFSIWQLGWMMLLYAAILALFSWAFGCFVLGLIFRFGTKIQSLSWGLVYIVQPLVAVYYPVDVLPSQLQWLSYFLPPTYVFEAARGQLFTGEVNWQYLSMGLLLDILFFVLCVWFLNRQWAWSKRTGVIVRMEQ